MNAPREFKADWDPMVEWRTGAKKNMGREEEFFGFEKWKWAATSFLRLQREHPDRFKLLRYERLMTRPMETVEELFAFTGLPMTDATRDFVRESRSTPGRDPNSVYRDKTDDDAWRNRLLPAVRDAVMEELRGTELERFTIPV
jgi:hypothetical protein